MIFCSAVHNANRRLIGLRVNNIHINAAAVVRFKEAKKDEAIDDYAILLLFEKNKRDETPIPCPACRSLNVRGNSYPVLGVKSWECNNILCPEKSKFNRGKRYSLSSLIKQEAIFYEENEIKNGTIKKWQLDLLTKPNTDDILDFLIKHYSLVRDTIEVPFDKI